MKKSGISSLLIGLSCLLFVSVLCTACHGSETNTSADHITQLGTTNTRFLDQSYITQSLDFALYDAWLRLDDALNLLESNTAQEKIATAQNSFLQELENLKSQKAYLLGTGLYGVQNQLDDMRRACLQRDRIGLSRLVSAYYMSQGLIFRKSGTIFMQLIVVMSILILIVMALLFFYQFTYARRIEIEKVLKATNKGQEEERRRIALELHDSVAQQMRYVSILAERVPDKALSDEIKTNQTQCIESIRNTCYILSSINMDKGNFPATLKNAVDSFQKRTGIETCLVLAPDINFDTFPQQYFHHLFRIIMELMTNIEKHADASEITILIRNPSAADKMHSGLMVFVTDDGKGMDRTLLEMMNAKKIGNIKDMHFGLQNIKLRLNEIHGSIRYMSEEGEGTEVEIRIEK